MSKRNVASTLECSSRGDKRFSALFAKIRWLDGADDTIENIYQSAKRFDGKALSVKEAKGKAPTSLCVLGHGLPVEQLTPFYETLWFSYLSANPDLVKYAKGFNHFTDMFKGRNTVNSQADVIASYIKDYDSLRSRVLAFLEDVGCDALTECVLHSGGAEGADLAFGKMAGHFFVNQNHYYYGPRSRLNAPYGNVEITQEQYEEGRVKMAEAAKYLYGYAYPKVKDVRICRNWLQVKNAEAIFAIGRLRKAGQAFTPDNAKDTRKLEHDCVIGGTGYAVARAILDNKPVYVFNLDDNQWWTFIGEKWEIYPDTPLLTTNFAGIGSRNITLEGEQAILALYQKFFEERRTYFPKKLKMAKETLASLKG